MEASRAANAVRRAKVNFMPHMVRNLGRGWQGIQLDGDVNSWGKSIYDWSLDNVGW